MGESFEKEIRLSAFYAALCSFKHERLLTSFSNKYINKNEKYNTLLDQCFGKNINSKKLNSLNDCLTEMLPLTLCDLSEISLIRFLTKQNHDAPIPNFIFEYNNLNNFDTNCKSYFAYHGTPFENLFSILTNGLVPDFTKDNLFGEGIYLSSELSMSLNYSKHGRMWEINKLGRYLSVVLMCEVYDDGSSNFKCAKDKNTPDSYFVITNKNLVKIKYILIYSSNEISNKINTKYLPLINRLFKSKKITIEMWVIPLLIYAAILILLATTKSSSLKNFLTKTFSRKLLGNDIY